MTAKPTSSGGNRRTQHAAIRNLCQRLVEARTRAGLTQTAVAEKVGKTQSEISKLEKGELAIDLIGFVRWTRALGLDPSEEMKLLASDVPRARRRHIFDPPT
jgi:transcriptional regulator with XRE-family HTH domain